MSQFNTPLTAASTLNSPPVPVQKRQPTYNIERFGSPLLLSTSTSANAQLEKTSDHCDGSACYRIAFSQPPPPNGCCGRSPGIDPTPSVTPVADAPDAESMPKRICLSPLTPTRMSISSVAAQNQLHDSKSASPPPDAAVAGVEVQVENESENQKPELTIGALNAVANEQNERLSSLPPSVRALFDNVDCVRVRDAAQLVRALDCVEEELERDSAAATATAPTPTPLRNRPPLKLLVVDSVAAVLRPSCVEQPAQWESALDPKHVNTDELLNKRTQYMNTIAVQLTRIAKKHELAVLVVNQLTSNETSQSRESQFQPHPQPEWAGAEPALGESWSHVCSLRVALARDPSSAAPGVRVACLLKDLARAACSKSARFQIAAEGVRDLLI